MREVVIRAVHVLVTLAKLLRPCGVRAGALRPAPAALDRYGWQQHCEGLFELPIAA